MPFPRTSLLAFAAAAVLVAPVALAGPAPRASQPAHASPALVHVSHGGKTAKLEPPAHRAQPSRSVGSPTEGRLVNGAHLPDAAYLRVVPVYAAGDARWGIESLVGMIDRAARAIRKQFPDAVLSVGHLSRPGGGEIDRHASHESGRDADVGYYVKNAAGKPIFADHFVAFKGDGTAATWPGAQFDDAKNWAFVSAIAGDPGGHVTHVFVASPIRARLLQYAEKIGAPLALRNRAAELMMQPHGSLPHDDHFHVRVGCPAGSVDRPTEKCIEVPLPHHRAGSAVAHNAHGGKPRASSSQHAPGHGGASSTPKPPESRAASHTDEAESKGESSFMPSLAPMIPGLDAAVIPVPIPGARPAPTGEAQPPSVDPALPPIDDPDGVLDKP